MVAQNMLPINLQELVTYLVSLSPPSLPFSSSPFRKYIGLVKMCWPFTLGMFFWRWRVWEYLAWAVSFFCSQSRTNLCDKIWVGKSTGGCHSHRLYSHSCDRTQSTVNRQTIRISAVNGQSGVGQRSNPSAERTRLVLQFTPNLAVGLHMRGTLIS